MHSGGLEIKSDRELDFFSAVPKKFNKLTNKELYGNLSPVSLKGGLRRLKLATDVSS